MFEHQDKDLKTWFRFQKIGNRPLQLIDCQNIFCELDKYCRQALPDLSLIEPKSEKVCCKNR